MDGFGQEGKGAAVESRHSVPAIVWRLVCCVMYRPVESLRSISYGPSHTVQIQMG